MYARTYAHTKVSSRPCAEGFCARCEVKVAESKDGHVAADDKATEVLQEHEAGGCRVVGVRNMREGDVVEGEGEVVALAGAAANAGLHHDIAREGRMLRTETVGALTRTRAEDPWLRKVRQHEADAAWWGW